MTSPGPLLILVASLIGQGTPPPAKPADFRLQDHRGLWHSLDDARGSKLVVLAFLGTDCPLAQAYAPRLAELARAYEGKGVAFFGVDSNELDGPVAIGRFASAHALPFFLLKDVGNELADRIGADRTPEVFVLDESRAVRYRGRVDDQYALGVHRPAPTRRDLAEALDALLAGKAPASTRADAAGCRIGRVGKPKGSATVTYAKDVAPILQGRCVACHRPGEIGPFSLTDYRQAAGWAGMIAEVVDEGRMPPWHASPDHGQFANDARLTPEEKRTIAAWAAAGAPEGNPADLPPPADFAEGWRIPKPDLVVEMPREVEIPAEGAFPYQHVVIDPKLTKDVWVKASQVRPGNPSVLHHLVVYVLPPGAKGLDAAGGDFLAAYAPGMPPRVLPEGMETATRRIRRPRSTPPRPPDGRSVASDRPSGGLHDCFVSAADHHAGGQLGIASRGLLDRLTLRAGPEPLPDALPEGLGQVNPLGHREGHHPFGQFSACHAFRLSPAADRVNATFQPRRIAGSGLRPPTAGWHPSDSAGIHRWSGRGQPPQAKF